LAKNLLQILQRNNIFDVKFSTWTSTDRSTLITQLLSSEDFVQQLVERLEVLKPHSFVSKQQSEYFQSIKNTLPDDVVLVTLDFSENYKYVAQDASQAFHFNNDQCSIFPVVYYYKDKNETQHRSLIFLSESTQHDTAAVYIIQSMLIFELKKSMKIKKIIYFSDGAKQHFKNKFVVSNLIYHERDFGIPAKWHYHATAHGKNACDGIGATFKREATRASLLAKPTKAILTPSALYN